MLKFHSCHQTAVRKTLRRTHSKWSALRSDERNFEPQQQKKTKSAAWDIQTLHLRSPWRMQWSKKLRFGGTAWSRKLGHRQNDFVQSGHSFVSNLSKIIQNEKVKFSASFDWRTLNLRFSSLNLMCDVGSVQDGQKPQKKHVPKRWSEGRCLSNGPQAVATGLLGGLWIGGAQKHAHKKKEFLPHVVSRENPKRYSLVSSWWLRKYLVSCPIPQTKRISKLCTLKAPTMCQVTMYQTFVHRINYLASRALLFWAGHVARMPKPRDWCCPG